MQLQQLLNSIETTVLAGTWNPDLVLPSVAFDSRQVGEGSLFIATKGTQVDGHRYIAQAVERGARVVVVQDAPESYAADALYLKVADTSKALGILASNFYGHPSRDLHLVAVTGTNGKTTTATLLYQLFTDLGYKVGLLSTVENRIAGQVLASTHTTPDALQLNRLLREMCEAGCEYAFMEASSHAIHQQRIAGLQFAGAVFTNISHDHLDYHGTFQNYIYAKKMLFDQLPASAFALVNLDDKRGEVMLQNTAARRYTYALRQMADFRATILENNLSGLILSLDGKELYARLVGDFNAYNLLAVYGTAVLLGANKDEVQQALSNLRAAEGRFDYIIAQEREVIGIVDYAHTPDALEKVLQTIDRLRKGNEKVITVVGCGGDRDTTKRPIMAKIACDYSQQVILTSDNPRTEDPNAILAQMQAGVPVTAAKRTLTISDRKEAIRTACQLATAGDIILVAGKGHEKYQEINGVKYPFDDKAVLQELL